MKCEEQLSHFVPSFEVREKPRDFQMIKTLSVVNISVEGVLTILFKYSMGVRKVRKDP